MIRPAFLFPILALSCLAHAQARPDDLLTKPDTWHATPEARAAIISILTLQTPHGGWPKNYSLAATRPARPGTPTIDNGATYTELRVLARHVRVTAYPQAREAFDRGLDYLLRMQYPNGGFPQVFPLETGYSRHITFNDNATLGVLLLLRDVATAKPDFAFTTPDQQSRSALAFARGLDCVLRCQIRNGETLTLWGQQHDEVNLAPTSARSYELASVASTESAGLVLLLMDQPNPDARTRAAIEAAVAYFQLTRISGVAYERVEGPQYESGRDRVLRADPAAPPLWARFYELGPFPAKPLFVDRDGKPRPRMQDLSHERRNGYAWYSTAPAKVLARHPEWRAHLQP
jgi:PelA/Pel-15E family pectate lyase